MFRRKSSSLPKDPVFPADLEGLGYVPSSLKKTSDVKPDLPPPSAPPTLPKKEAEE